MDLGLKGKTAVVTGGARGIGRRVALLLAEEGAEVAVLDLITEGDWGSAKTVQMILEKGGKAKDYQTDITQVDNVQASVAKVTEELGPPEILINCAACVDHVQRVLDQDPKLWERDLKVNLTGQFHMVRALLPSMVQKKFGRIVNFASVAGLLGGYGQLSYSVTKAGIVGFTKTIALEFARAGITCNCVAPGLVETELVGMMNPKQKERIVQRTAFKRLGKPEEVAQAVVFLASAKASYITGEVLVVDGGIQLFGF